LDNFPYGLAQMDKLIMQAYGKENSNEFRIDYEELSNKEPSSLK